MNAEETGEIGPTLRAAEAEKTKRIIALPEVSIEDLYNFTNSLDSYFEMEVNVPKAFKPSDGWITLANAIMRGLKAALGEDVKKLKENEILDFCQQRGVELHTTHLVSPDIFVITMTKENRFKQVSVAGEYFYDEHGSAFHRRLMSVLRRMADELDEEAKQDE